LAPSKAQSRHHPAGRSGIWGYRPRGCGWSGPAIPARSDGWRCLPACRDDPARLL